MPDGKAVFNRFAGILLGLALGSAWSVEGPPAAPSERVHPQARPPIAWDLSTGAGVVWSVDLGHRSGAAPLVVGDRVLALAEPGQLVCLDAATGREHWRFSKSFVDRLPPDQRAEASRVLMAVVEAWERGEAKKDSSVAAEIGILEKRFRVPAVARSNYIEYGYTYAAPLCDGDGVYLVNGTGLICCVGLADGRERWTRPWPETLAQTVTASGPVLVGDLLVVKTRLAEGSRQYILVALDRASGEERWRSPAFNAAGHGEWGPQAVAEIDGEPCIVTPAGVVVRAADGQLLAELGAHCSYGSGPVAAGDVVIFDDFAARLMRASDAVTATGLWRAPKGPCQGSCAAIHGDLAFRARATGLWILDLASGEETTRHDWSIPDAKDRGYGRNGTAATVLAGGYGYCAIGRERLVIFKADRSGAFVGCQFCPGLERHAHPVPAGDRLYLRAGTALWCLGDGG